MKATTLLNRTVLATVLVAASVSAFAGGGGGGPRGAESRPYGHATVIAAGAEHADATTTVADTTSTGTSDAATKGKTREQVRAELLQAEETGFLPIHKNDYPPSAETVARNRARFQQVEQAWQAHGEITAAQK